MRKLKLIMATLALMLGWSNAWAENAYQTFLTSERGWSEVTNLSSMTLSDYYFAIVSADNTDLMVKADLAQPGQQATNHSMWYMTAKDPLRDNSYLWTLEANNTEGYVGTTIRNVDRPVRVFQTTEGQPWFCRTNWETAAVRWTSYSFLLNDGKYTIQALANGGTNYLGLWTPANGYVSGQELAGNKSGNEIGKFYLYAIAKTTANTNIISASDASSSASYEMAPSLFGRLTSNYSGPTGYYGDYRYLEKYTNTDAGMAVGDKITKSITNAPNGLHKIKVLANAAWISGRGLGDTAPSVNDNSTVVTINGVSKNVPVRTDGSYDPVTLSFDTRVTDGNISFAIHNNDAAAFWFVFDIVSDEYVGDPLASLIADYYDAMDEAEAFTEESMWAAAWTTLQTAISTNTLDLDDTGLTEDDLTTAISNLETANAAATASVNSKTTYNTAVSTIDGGTNVNLTSLIVNPSFESDLTGWTNTGSMAIQTNTALVGKTGSKYAEYWQPNGTKGVSQTVGLLPAGVYQLTLHAKARGVTSAKVFANSNEKSMTIEDIEHDYFLIFEIADKTAINIGFEGVGTGASASWFAIDNFTLTYLTSSYAALPYTLATGKMGTDKATAQSNAKAAFDENPSLATYNALLDAIADAEASKANYATLKNAIDKAEDIIIANNFVTAAATTAFRNEIDEATEAWTDVTYTDAECTTEIATLGTTTSGWHSIDDSGAAGSFMTSTWGKTHENWWTDFYINTWSTEGDNDGSGFSVPFFEYFANAENNLGTKEMTATLTGLNNGAYEVELWARVQRRSNADFNANGNMITMSVNDGSAVSIMNNTSNNVGSDTSVMRLGRYTARGMVTDGTLTLKINVWDGSNVHWLCWRDIKYTKLTNQDVTVSSAGYATYASDVDLNYDGVSGLTAYKVSVSGSKAILSPVTEVPAGAGVVLKGAEGTYTVPVMSGAATLDGNALVRGTGAAVSTNETISEVNYNNYVLSTDDDGNNLGFYQANGETVPTNRAYLHTTAGGSSRLTFVFEDETTGISDASRLMNNGEMRNDNFFNLNGQKVSQPTKGLYIKNGKKVVIK